MKALHILAFGKLRLEVDGQMVNAFPTRHAEELLAYLILHPHIAHSRERLIDILWPDCPLQKARGRFSTALWQLRRIFKQLELPFASYIQANRQDVTFLPDYPVLIDVVCFQQHLTAVRTINQEQQLREAVQLYTGPLCEGIYSDWCLIEREHLTHQWLQALGKLMVCCLKRQDYHNCLQLGQTILQEDPLREEVHRTLMHCYWKIGQRDLAVRQFHQCATILMNELHLLPMSETRELFQRIMNERVKLIEEKNAAQRKLEQKEIQVAFTDYLKASQHLNTLIDQLR